VQEAADEATFLAAAPCCSTEMRPADGR
jgi:hypothetical protein